MVAYSGVSAVTASAVLPFNYWNVFVSQNASAFNQMITALSAQVTGLSGAYTGHSAQVSGIHGLRTNAGPVGSLSGSGFIVQSATAGIAGAGGTVWVVWPQPFAAVPVVVATLHHAAAANTFVHGLANQVGSAQLKANGDGGDYTAHVLGFGRI